MDMDVTVSELRPDNPFSSTLPPPANTESASAHMYALEQQVNLQDLNNSDLQPRPTSARPSTQELETDENDDECANMVEKWRLIRLADKIKSQKKVHDTMIGYPIKCWHGAANLPG